MASILPQEVPRGADCQSDGLGRQGGTVPVTSLANHRTETVDKLKAQPGGDIITCGGGTLVANLTAKGLLDELHLFVDPTAIAAGMPVFPHLGAHQPLRLVAVQPFDCGITALHFEPKRS